MTVENGDLVLPDGMRYRLLLLPANRQIPMQSLKEIERLVKAGASVSGPRPDRIPGLTNYPNEDRELQKIAGTIWGNCDGNFVKEALCGKGHVFWGLPVSEVLAKRGISPDVVFREPRSGEGVLPGSLAAGILFNHRSSKDEETYFISNQEDCFREVVASFRRTRRARLDSATPASFGLSLRCVSGHDWRGPSHQYKRNTWKERHTCHTAAAASHFQGHSHIKGQKDIR